MNEFDQRHLAAWVDDHLEAYVDGELSPDDRRRVEAFVRVDEKAHRQLRIAERVRGNLRAIPTPVCPPEVSGAVIAHARSEARQPDRTPAPRRGGRLAESLARAWSSVLRPSLAVGIFALLVIAAGLLGRPPAEQPDTVTRAEVEQALQEVRWTLAFVSDVGRRTGRSIRREVLEERVTQPVQRALDEALNTEPTS